MVSSPLSYGFLVYNKNHCVKTTSYLCVFSPNEEKYGPDKTQNTDTFYAVNHSSKTCWLGHFLPKAHEFTHFYSIALAIWKTNEVFLFYFCLFLLFLFLQPPVPKPVSCGRQRVKDFHSAISISLTS